MSKLNAFLNPKPLKEEREVIISDRFCDEKGDPIPFKIRALTQWENDMLRKKCTAQKLVEGTLQEVLDTSAFTAQLIVAATLEPDFRSAELCQPATLEPDFRSAELCQHYGVMDPAELVTVMLSAGEYAALGREVSRLSGFGSRAVAEKNS